MKLVFGLIMLSSAMKTLLIQYNHYPYNSKAVVQLSLFERFRVRIRMVWFKHIYFV